MTTLSDLETRHSEAVESGASQRAADIRRHGRELAQRLREPAPAWCAKRPPSTKAQKACRPKAPVVVPLLPAQPHDFPEALRAWLRQAPYERALGLRGGALVLVSFLNGERREAVFSSAAEALAALDAGTVRWTAPRRRDLGKPRPRAVL